MTVAGDDDSALGDMLDELGRDHEAMRVRILELLRLLEDAVDAQVAGERRVAELEDQMAVLEAELNALRNTRLFRLAAPLRSVYGRLWGRRR